MSGLWICHGFKYARVIHCFECAWICLNNSWISLIMPECALICLNGFCFTFIHCNPLSKGTVDCFPEKQKFDFCYISWKYLILFFVLDQACLTQTGLTSLNFSIFIVNNFYCVINCLNMNGVTICRAECLEIVTLKVFSTSCFCYNSKEKITKFSKSKTNRIDMSFHEQVL